jgi:hypothetical protein
LKQRYGSKDIEEIEVRVRSEFGNYSKTSEGR